MITKRSAVENFIKIEKEVGNIYVYGYFVAKLRLKNSYDSLLLVGDKIVNKDNLTIGYNLKRLSDDNIAKKALEDRLFHCQFFYKVALKMRGVNQNILVSRSMTSAPKFTKITKVGLSGAVKTYSNYLNTKLYPDDNLRGGFQYLNNNQVLLHNMGEDDSMCIFEKIESPICDNIANKIKDSYKLPDGNILQFNEEEIISTTTTEFSLKNDLIHVSSLLDKINVVSTGKGIGNNSVANTEFCIHLNQHQIIKDYSCKFCIEIMNISYSPEGVALCSYFGLI